MSDGQEESDVKYTSASFSFFQVFFWILMAASRSKFDLDLTFSDDENEFVRIKVIDRFDDDGNSEKRWL